MRIESVTMIFPDDFPDAEVELITSLADQFYSALRGGLTDEEECDQQRLMSGYYAFIYYTASSHFVFSSRFAVDIARAVQKTPEEVMEMAKTSQWEEAVRFWGFRDTNITPLVEQRDTTPVPLREVFLLEKAFQKYGDVRFVTYDGFIDTRVKEVARYDIHLADDIGIHKHDVILAFPKDNMADVKRGIKSRKSIADLGLKPIRRHSDRPKIEVAARRGAIVECVMRNGLVVVGENIWINRYNIVVRVGGEKKKGGKVVLLYKHALYGFKMLKNQSESHNASGSGDDFDAEGQEDAD